jgi:tetratricopeptide (TPR) repeat protein
MEAKCELDTFYQEVALRFPDEEYWVLQSARHWFNSIMESPVDYYFEDQNLEQSIQGIPDTLFFMWNAAKSNPFYTRDRFKNPVRGLTIEYPYLVEFPYRVCIANINRAISLAESDENMGDLYTMLGTIYYATRQYNKAAEQYAAAIEFRPGDANLRRTAAYAYLKSFRLTNAFNHLDTLRQKDRLLADDYLTFAAKAIHGKQFVQAAEVLESASQLFTGIQKDSVMQLKARMYFVQQDARCVAYYTDSIQTTMTLADRLYAVASMYAIKADDARAYQYLNQSLEHGFLYGYVLENDPVWARFRLQKQWDQIIKNRSFKTYAITDFSSSQ